MSSSTSASELMRRSERLGLKILGLALALLLALVAAVQPFAEEAVERYSPMRYQLMLAEKHASETLIIAVGDSHTGLGFDSLDRRVNSIGFPGEAVPEMMEKLKLLLPRLPKLKAVLLQAQPHMFYRHRDFGVRAPYREMNQGRGVFHPFEKILLQFDPCCRGQVLKYASKEWRKRFWRLVGRDQAASEPDIDPVIKENGFLIYKPNPKLPLDRHDQAKAEFNSYVAFAPIPRLRDSYEEIVTMLKQRGVLVLLTHYPLAQEYLEGIPIDARRDAEEFFKTIASRYSLETCGSWEAFKDRQDMFLNSDHLSEAGAKAYWPVLAQCIQRLLPDVKVASR